MSANTNPIFPATPNVNQVQATVANTNRDGTGTLVTVWTPGTNGSLLSKIVIEVPGTSSVDVIRLFWDDATHKYLYDELLVTAITPSTTVAAFRLEYIPSSPEVYKSGWILKASTHIGQATNILALGGDY